MNRTPASHDPQARRAGVRRTVWIAAGVAVALFLLIILKGVTA
ncbi:hypothetical protein [Mizugakiibacter sediminis]|uniref:Uncharacterized protein n=1 Tax=Mizugakiibacter sediminis TaxID=1475481 RepID=A0A0U1PC43_9GAMM|nr:hypothetical protein [Mizugakiibacter sediminis]